MSRDGPVNGDLEVYWTVILEKVWINCGMGEIMNE